MAEKGLGRMRRAKPLPRSVGFGVCAINGVGSGGFILAPLNLMRGHTAFEILFQNACKYASIFADRKVGVLLMYNDNVYFRDYIPSFTGRPGKAHRPTHRILQNPLLRLFSWKVVVLANKSFSFL